MKKLRIDVVAVLVMVAGAAVAGDVWHGASCYVWPDGSGYCSGTFKGFRDEAVAKSYVDFNQASDGSRYFHAVISDTDRYESGYCIPNAAVAAMWPQAMTYNGYFSIDFDANGVCTRLVLSNSSTSYPGPEANSH